MMEENGLSIVLAELKIGTASVGVKKGDEVHFYEVDKTPQQAVRIARAIMMSRIDTSKLTPKRVMKVSDVPGMNQSQGE